MIHHNVPLITQQNRMSCWHASARMLFAFRNMSVGPLQSVYSQGGPNSNAGGLPGKRFVDLAKDVGLGSVPRVNVSYSAEGVELLLRRHGPLWAAGYWDGAPHIVVVTGVTAGGQLEINDPAPGKGRRVESMGWFNDKLASQLAHPILFLDGAQPAPHALDQMHTVARGESLWAIAASYYRDPELWPRIYSANRRIIGRNPDLIRPGARLRIPGAS